MLVRCFQPENAVYGLVLLRPYEDACKMCMDLTMICFEGTIKKKHMGCPMLWKKLS